MTDSFAGFTDITQGFLWIESFTNFEKKPMESREYRLDRMVALLALFGNPHTKRPSIHLAGSKGKGSIATLVSRGLSGLGLRPGLYRSPHIEDYRERITLDGQFFAPEVYGAKINQIKETLDNNSPWIQSHGQPTTFELLTLLGFLIFLEQDCDIYVLETGLGGRLDATNVVDPLFSIITSLELEHTDILGPTLVHIGREKAGIIKPRKPVFIFPQQRIGLGTLQEIADRQNSTCYFPLGKLIQDFPEFSNLQITWEGISGNFEGVTYRSRIPGVMHLTNCVFVSRLLTIAFEQGILASLGLQGVDEKYHGVEDFFNQLLAQVSIPGRMETLLLDHPSIPSKIPLILDGAHTPFSAMILKKNLELLTQHGLNPLGPTYEAPEKPTKFGLILAISQGKKVDEILDALVPVAQWIIITSPGFFKTSNPEEVYFKAQEKLTQTNSSQEVYLEVQPSKALELAITLFKDQRIPVVVTGSFYLLGEIKGYLKSSPILVANRPIKGPLHES